MKKNTQLSAECQVLAVGTSNRQFLFKERDKEPESTGVTKFV